MSKKLADYSFHDCWVYQCKQKSECPNEALAFFIGTIIELPRTFYSIGYCLGTTCLC